ncbi:MAG: hypothetical protein H0U54_13950 [Acidobacteria bacterium]|nr:hypothetical protein [Acidobacteriota bacterium]
MKSARLIVHAFCFALLSVPPAVELNAQQSNSLRWQSDASNNLTPYVALVTKNEARFILPVPIRSDWRWRLPATKDNAQEYRLDVSVENEGRKFAFGFYLWKRSGALPEAGSFSDLIKAGQTSVFGRTPAGMNSIIREAGIKLKLDKNMLIIIIRGQENVKRLFSGRPSEVTFAIKLPGETPTTQTAPILYQD